jgi:methyltransferase (TIGR00027 family)
MEKRIDTKSSRTAEWTCICRAASSLEKEACYKSDDTVALQILPSPIKNLIQNPVYRKLHCRFGVPKGMYEYIIARTKYMDAVYQRAIAEQFDQIAILGAGFDSRAIRFPAAEGLTQVYEFDSRHTQQRKLDLYAKTNVTVPANVHFEAIDFVKESLTDRLSAIGFLKNKRSLFLMEGVSMYLDAEALHNIFQTMIEYMGQHSLVAFDYIYADVLQHQKRHYGETEIMQAVSGVKEAWRFGIEKDHIESFLDKYGLRLVNHMSARDMEEIYFRDEHGRTIRRINDTHCLVTAERRDSADDQPQRWIQHA